MGSMLYASHPGGMESAWLGVATTAAASAAAVTAAHRRWFIARIWFPPDVRPRIDRHWRDQVSPFAIAGQCERGACAPRRAWGWIARSEDPASPDTLPRGILACQAASAQRFRPRQSRLRIERRARGVSSVPVQLPCPCSELIAHGVELVRDGEIKALPGELVAPVRLPLDEARNFHAGSLRCSSACDAHLLDDSGGFGSPSRRFRRARKGRLGHLIGSPHDALPQLFGLVSQDLSLPADELALKLGKFLRFLHAKELLNKVERVGERFFGQEHGALADRRCLLIHAVDGFARDHEQALEGGLALCEILLRYFAHPVHAVVGRLHGALGILLGEVAGTFSHGSASLSLSLGPQV